MSFSCYSQITVDRCRLGVILNHPDWGRRVHQLTFDLPNSEQTTGRCEGWVLRVIWNSQSVSVLRWDFERGDGVLWVICFFEKHKDVFRQNRDSRDHRRFETIKHVMGKISWRGLTVHLHWDSSLQHIIDFKARGHENTSPKTVNSLFSKVNGKKAACFGSLYQFPEMSISCSVLQTTTQQNIISHVSDDSEAPLRPCQYK